MLAAIALATVLVQPGNTLSGIAASHGVTLAATEAANPQIANYDLIYAGQRVNLPGAGTAGAPAAYRAPARTASSSPASIAPAHQTQRVSAPSTVSTVSTASSPSDSASGVADTQSAAPGSFQSCVIQRESNGDPQVMNGSGHYGLYQFTASTWAEYGGSAAAFGHASVAQQNQVFDNAMAAGGESNWAPYDGC